MTDDIFDRIMDTQAAADALGVSIATVKRWCAEGKLDAHNYGRGWIITRESVEKAKENDMDDKQDLRAEQIYRMSPAQYIAEYLDPMHAVIDYDDPEQYADDTLDQWPEEDAPLASRQELIDYWHEQTGE